MARNWLPGVKIAVHRHVWFEPESDTPAKVFLLSQVWRRRWLCLQRSARLQGDLVIKALICVGAPRPLQNGFNENNDIVPQRPGSDVVEIILQAFFNFIQRIGFSPVSIDLR
jgi:hypothetical protein